MSFAEPDEDDEDDEEQWLQEPQIDSPVGDWRGRKDRHKEKVPPRPIFVGKRTRYCQHCRQKCAIELFRDGKCLACQAADFLGPP